MERNTLFLYASILLFFLPRIELQARQEPTQRARAFTLSAFGSKSGVETQETRSRCGGCVFSLVGGAVRLTAARGSNVVDIAGAGSQIVFPYARPDYESVMLAETAGKGAG
jgi:hypothetical protein